MTTSSKSRGLSIFYEWHLSWHLGSHKLAQAQQAGFGADVERQLIGEVIEMTGFVVN